MEKPGPTFPIVDAEQEKQVRRSYPPVAVTSEVMIVSIIYSATNPAMLSTVFFRTTMSLSLTI